MQKKLVCCFLPVLVCLVGITYSQEEGQAKFSGFELGIRVNTIPANYAEFDYISIDPDYYYTIEPELTKGHFLKYKESFPGRYYRTINFFNGGLRFVKSMKKTYNWYYRLGIDYFYYRNVYDDDSESYAPSVSFLLGYNYKVSSLKFSPALGYRKKWKFLTFKGGFEVPLGITAKGKKSVETLHQDSLYINLGRPDYEIYPGKQENYQTNPRRVFAGLNVFVGIEVNLLKRFAAGIEMNNGFTYNSVKGNRYFNDEYYDLNGDMYRNNTGDDKVIREGFWWEPLRFSLSLSYRL